MRTKIILITIIATLLLFSVASSAVNAKGQGSLINELAVIDSFHPPTSDYSGRMMYNEWHYFNVIDEEQNLSIMTTLRLSGDIYDPFNSSAAVLLSYSTPDGGNTSADFYPIIPAEVEYSSETPDLRIYSSTVTLTEEGYHVHVESADNQMVFDAILKPFTKPSPIFFVSAFTETDLIQEIENETIVNSSYNDTGDQTVDIDNATNILTGPVSFPLEKPPFVS